MKTKLILEILKKTGKTTDVLLDVIVGGHTYKNLKRKVFYPTLPDFSKTNSEQPSEKVLRRNFYVLLSKLKKQGFIKKERKDDKSYWLITNRGKEKLESFKNILNFPHTSIYKNKKEKDDGLNIVIFDIPEKEKRKRTWLRASLLALDFALLQKSVWIGKNKLPKDFLEDLEDLGIIKYIHIFNVSKTGTLKEN